MELITGIARNIQSVPGAGALNLDVGGRDVRLEMVADQTLVQDGDELIVAGNEEAGAVVGYAYRNITQGYGCRASCRNDAFQGSLTLIFSLGALWVGLDAQGEIPALLWIQRIGSFAIALLFAVFAAVYVILIVEKFLAGFRVNRAALETLTGTARNVHHSTDNCSANFEIDARRVELSMPREIVIDDGDEIVVTGQRAGDVVIGMNYRNATRGAIGRRWIALGLVSTLVLIGVWLALLVTGLWFEGEEALVFTAIRRALALVFMMATLVFALDRFFRWRLDLEVWRGVRGAKR